MSEHSPVVGTPTAGTWEFHEEGFERPYIYVYDVGVIAELRQVGNSVERPDSADRDLPETAANGHLIAAAPDLLAACEAVRTEALRVHDAFLSARAAVAMQTMLAILDPAIAKAKGEARPMSEPSPRRRKTAAEQYLRIAEALAYSIARPSDDTDIASCEPCARCLRHARRMEELDLEARAEFAELGLRP